MSVKCPDCTAINPSNKNRCLVCYKHLTDPEWRCQKETCLHLNPLTSKKCLVCGRKKSDKTKETRSKSSDRTGRSTDQKEVVSKNFLCVDDRQKRSRSTDNLDDSRWNCCKCTFFNNAQSKRCEICMHEKGTCCDDVTGHKWKCKYCDYLNLELFTRCSNCSKKKKRHAAFFKDRKKEKHAKDKDQIAKQTADDGKQTPQKTADVGKQTPKQTAKDGKQTPKQTADDGKQTPKQTADDGRKQRKTDNTDQTWMCKRCSSSNDNNERKCGTCGHDRPRVVGFFENQEAKPPGRHDMRQSIKSKLLRTIKTREVEREWRNIVSNCQRMKTNFVDQAFPPSDRSLFRNPRPEGSGIQWSRLKDVTDEKGKGPIDWKVCDKPSADDIMQGSIGNCWFICALAVVAERRKLIERMIVTEKFCPEGAYVVRLCKDGSWKTVVLDDYFPVDKYKRLKYSTARRGQLWVPLIEKAAAKIHGCYEALKAGRTVESLALLTGEPCEHLSLLENQDLSKTINDALIWSKLTHAKECRYLMCTSCGIPGGFSSEHCKRLGLITEHAYSLLDVFTLDTGERLLQIRNPWGSESWNGDWCDDSAKWHKVKPEVKAQLKPDGNANGIFWMEFKEFRKYFKDIDICKTRDWHETRVKGTFPSSPSGPWKLVKIYVPKKTDLCLGLIQKNKRGTVIEGDFLDICIVVFENLPNGKKRVVENSRRDSKSYVGCDVERLPKGEYSIACLALKHLNEGMSLHQLDFVLTIHSSEKIVVEESDSTTTRSSHYLADTLIQLAIDKGEKSDLKYNIYSYSLSWDGLIYVVENNDEKKYTSFQQDCRKTTNLISSRKPAITQDVIPPKHRQVLIVMSTEKSGKGSGWSQSISYISHTYKTLEYFGDKTRQHNPDISKKFECLHLPRPIT